MKAAALILCLALTGCGAYIKASGPRTVVVGADTSSQALAAATAECAKHNRHARLAARDGFSYTFDCVD
jgi:methylase of polypeptide subunit release factors